MERDKDWTRTYFAQLHKYHESDVRIAIENEPSVQQLGGNNAQIGGDSPEKRSPITVTPTSNDHL